MVDNKSSCDLALAELKVDEVGRYGEGADDALQRANKRWKAMLKEYEKPPIDLVVDEALKDYIGRKKFDRADAWY